MANYIEVDIKCPCGNIAATKHFYEGNKASGTSACSKCRNVVEWQFDGSRVKSRLRKQR